jgi:hypothetical protein
LNLKISQFKMQASPAQPSPSTPVKNEFKSPIPASKSKKESSSKKFAQDVNGWSTSPLCNRMMNTLNVPQADMQERVLLQSPMPNPMIIMLHSPHMCGQTTAATQKQFCNAEGLSDRKAFAIYEQQDSRSPNAVRNFMYPEAVQKHFQSNQDELMNSFEKSPEMMANNDFSALHAEGQQLHFSAQKDQTDFKQPME